MSSRDNKIRHVDVHDAAIYFICLKISDDDKKTYPRIDALQAEFKSWNGSEWMDEFDFASFSTIFQSHQDDGWVVKKICEQWNPVYN